MTTDGPPSEEPGPTPGTGPLEKSVTDTDQAKRSATPRLCAADALRHRRQASYRCEPLASGHRDPWQPWRPERLSDRQVEGVVAAAAHLAAVGLTPVFDVPTLRQLRTSGHRGLADTLRGDR